MGLRDILTGRHEVKGPAPDRLFAISTAYVTLQTEHQIDPAGTAAIVFQALATSDFETTITEMEEVVTATGGESGTKVATQDDSYGYRWMVLRNPAAPPASKTSRSASTPSPSSIETAGYGERLLCAVFAFTDAQAAAHLLHLQLQARLLVPVRARPGRRRRSARPSASCSSRRRWPPNCRSSPNSSAGSRSGGYRIPRTCFKMTRHVRMRPWTLRWIAT